MVQLINSATTANRNFAARSLDPAQRRDLAVQVVAGNESVSQTARDHNVSRKFVAAQTDKVQSALDRAFASPTPEHGDSDKVLFALPVTRKWIEQSRPASIRTVSIPPVLRLMRTCNFIAAVPP